MGGEPVVLAALIGRPLVLPPAIVERYPELAAVRWRQGGLPLRIAGLCLGRASVAAITLWRTVFLAQDARLEAELLLHELRHVHQFEASAAFPLLYLWETLFHGYYGNRFEAEARAYASRRVRSSPGSQV